MVKCHRIFREGCMGDEVILEKFVGQKFWDFFPFIDESKLVCFGDKLRYSDKGLIISDLDVCFFVNYLESEHMKRLSIYWDHTLKNLSRIDSNFRIEEIFHRQIKFNNNSISLQDLIDEVSRLKNQVILINFQVLQIHDNDNIHDLFRFLKNISLSNSLCILVFGLFKSRYCVETNEWDISFEYADIAISYELLVDQSLLNPDLFSPRPVDGLYRLAVAKNRYGGEHNSIFLGKVLGKGYYIIDGDDVGMVCRTKNSTRINSDRYLKINSPNPEVIEDNEIIAHVGFFGFNLNGLFEQTKKMSLSKVLIADISITDDPIYEDLDEPIIILEVNPDFINKGDDFTFWKSTNFFIISGHRKFLKVIGKKRNIDVYLFTMEEALPFLVKHRSNFIDYWNDKLDTYIKILQFKEKYEKEGKDNFPPEG